MRPTQRVESHVAVPLPEAYNTCLGLASAQSYLYFFYPGTIRVYENFPQKSIPQISQELIIPQRKITRFAVNNLFIAMLFDDSKLIIRSREHWRRVLYSFDLAQQSTKIDSLQILSTDRILYSFYNEQSKNQTYAFITLAPLTKQSQKQIITQAKITFWNAPCQYEQVLHLKQLGYLEYFYFGLQKNGDISFGTYYQGQQQNQLKQFQFGKIKQQNTGNCVHGFNVLSLTRSEQTLKKQGEIDQIYKNNSFYLIKIVSQDLNQKNQGRRLMIKHQKFYDPHSYQSQHQKQKQDQYNDVKDSEQQRLQAYTRMMTTLQQINNIREQSQVPNGSKDQNNKQSQSPDKDTKCFTISLKKDQIYVNHVVDGNSIYIATNERIFKFKLECNAFDYTASIDQVCKLPKGSKLLEVCQSKLYVAFSSLYVLAQQIDEKSFSKAFQFGQIQKMHQEAQTVNDKQNQVGDQKRQSMNKKMVDVETQTISQDFFTNKYLLQQRQDQKVSQNKPQFAQKSLGPDFPMCPRSHQSSLLTISLQLSQIQTSFTETFSQKFQSLLQKQKQKINRQITRKFEQIVIDCVSQNVTQHTQASLKNIFEKKLQEVNGYIYSLTMQNLLLLKQEIQQDEAKENMIRCQLIKKQIHEFEHNKKAMAQMIETCKKRELQKIVFIQQVKQNFTQIVKKVELLEQKVRTMVEGQQECQAKIFDEIQVIKIMIKNSDPAQKARKLSILSQERDIIINEDGTIVDEKGREKEKEDQLGLSSEDDLEPGESDEESDEESSRESQRVHELVRQPQGRYPMYVNNGRALPTSFGHQHTPYQHPQSINYYPQQPQYSQYNHPSQQPYYRVSPYNNIQNQPPRQVPSSSYPYSQYTPHTLHPQPYPYPYPRQPNNTSQAHSYPYSQPYSHAYSNPQFSTSPPHTNSYHPYTYSQYDQHTQFNPPRRVIQIQPPPYQFEHKTKPKKSKESSLQRQRQRQRQRDNRQVNPSHLKMMKKNKNNAQLNKQK